MGFLFSLDDLLHFRKSERLVAGVDVGKTGAIALYDGSRHAVADFPSDIPSHAQLFRDLGSLPIKLAIVEKQTSFGMGRTSAFTFGGGYDRWQLGFAVYLQPYELVDAKTWQKYFGLASIEKSERKPRSLKEARQRFPTAELHLQKHHGRAEALLIAWYAYSRMWGAQ